MGERAPGDCAPDAMSVLPTWKQVPAGGSSRRRYVSASHMEAGPGPNIPHPGYVSASPPEAGPGSNIPRLRYVSAPT
jgi:hypothetical protein